MISTATIEGRAAVDAQRQLLTSSGGQKSARSINPPARKHYDNLDAGYDPLQVAPAINNNILQGKKSDRAAVRRKL